MRIRISCFSLALAFLLFLGSGGIVMAQDAPDTKQPAAEAAPSVAPDIQQKAKTYKGSPTPPRELQREADGHWTPYTLPAKAPEGAVVYTIVQGDTLSGIAQAKLGTWLLWPQIWDLNPYIKDAHWIYPGDPLYIKRPQVISEAVPVEEMIPEAEPEAKPAEPAMQLEEAAPMPPVSARDVYCSGYITKDFVHPHLVILTGPNPSREALAAGDVVYLNEGRAEGMEAGSQYGVVQEGQKVGHPKTGKNLGRFIRRLGRVKVLAVQEHTSIAKIDQSCDEITYGMPLVPWKIIPIPWDIQKSQELPLTLALRDEKPLGRVIWSEDRLQSVGQHNLLYINLGSGNNLLPGDRLWVFRFPGRQGTMVGSTRDLFREQKIDVGPKDLFRPPKPGKLKKEERRKSEEAGVSTEKLEGKAARGDKPDWNMKKEGVDTIPEVIGEAVILTTNRRTACAKLLLSKKEVTLGDWVQAE